MKSFDAYQYICVRCNEPLLSSLDNKWLIVGTRHVTASPKVELEVLPSFATSDVTLSGTKELADCDIQQTYCRNCDAKLGLRCVGAAHEKRGFMYEICRLSVAYC